MSIKLLKVAKATLKTPGVFAGGVIIIKQIC